ncbi:hypothetical protein WR25_13374 [Diploscapter pachys]|uniref:Gamma-secretase subunit Aph-1 n=1 Tax=Diploscapter pachys TaxID=2018661 RepID=A0A2A2J2X5_9BILA|nr:hypothetical protein WR25_13374 [Diploscapter pachys]
MGWLLSASCFIVALAPSFALFCRFVAHDPLRIILFVLGAFFWLLSLLLASFFNYFISFLLSTIVPSLIVFICLQEIVRVLYFMMLKKAQSGLNKMTSTGGQSIAPGVSQLHNSRHMLALVCGLGMGVCSSLFHCMNTFAALSGEASFGLPQAMEANSPQIISSSSSLRPFYVAITSAILPLLHAAWTIMVWHSFHRIHSSASFLPAFCALITHLIMSALSFQSSNGHYILVMLTQFVLLLVCVTICHQIMGGTMKSFTNATVRCVTLRAFFRPSNRPTAVPVETHDEQQPNEPEENRLDEAPGSGSTSTRQTTVSRTTVT